MTERSDKTFIFKFHILFLHWLYIYIFYCHILLLTLQS